MALVKRLVEDFQVDVNYIHDYLYCKIPLWVASNKNQADIARYLLKRGAKTVAEYYGKCLPSPLAGFASHGNIPMLKILLKHGAEIDGNTMKLSTHNLTSFKFLRVVGGSLNLDDVLSQLYGSPIHIDKRTFEYIHKKILKMTVSGKPLRINVFPDFNFTLHMIRDLVECNKLDLAKYVVKHGTREYERSDAKHIVEINNMLSEREETEFFLYFNRKFRGSRFYFDFDEQWICWLEKAVELGSRAMARFILSEKGWHWVDFSPFHDWWNEECIFYSLSDDTKTLLWNLVYPGVKCPKEDFKYLPPPDDFTCRESDTCPILFEKLETGKTVACSRCWNPFSKEAIDRWRNIHNSCPLCKETGDFYLI